MHTGNQGRAVLRTLAWMPVTLIGAGIALGGMGLFGLQTIFLGFGFHC